MQNPTPDNAELEVLRAELQAEYDAARDREYEAQCDTGVILEEAELAGIELRK